MKNDRIRLLLKLLNKGLYEKEHVVSLSLLSAVAGESIFLLGPPGVAKSMIARRLKLAFSGGTSFEYLMSRFSTPDEIFGPVSISKLKNSDAYERLTEGYLPSASVVFLDEIWKAGPGIQNALLTVLNEKIFRNGNISQKLPLKGIIAASNELPALGEGLEALWDRFMIRYLVDGISNPDSFNQMIASIQNEEPQIDPELSITDEQLAQWHYSRDRVEVSSGIFSLIHKIRSLIADYNSKSIKENLYDKLYISDRRWKKMLNIVRTSAFLNASSSVRYTDMTLFIHCMWNEPDQQSDVIRIFSSALTAAMEEEVKLTLLNDRIQALKDELRAKRTLNCDNEEHLKIVSGFFYQVEGVHTKDQILIYISEFQPLQSEQSEVFVLQADKRKPGVKILKKYERSRHPGVFPKDLYQVRRSGVSILINDKPYSLVGKTDKKNKIGENTVEVQSVLSASVIQAVVGEVGQVRLLIDSTEATEKEYIKHHFFLNDVQKEMMQQAFREIKKRLVRLENETEEIKHYCKLEGEL